MTIGDWWWIVPIIMIVACISIMIFMMRSCMVKMKRMMPGGHNTGQLGAGMGMAGCPCMAMMGRFMKSRIEPSSPTLETSAIKREMNSCIRGVIRQLPKEYSTVVMLSDIEGFKDSEIADILDLSIQNVKIRLHRARARLRADLEKFCTFYRGDDNEFACDLKESFRELKRELNK